MPRVMSHGCPSFRTGVYPVWMRSFMKTPDLHAFLQLTMQDPDWDSPIASGQSQVTVHGVWGLAKVMHALATQVAEHNHEAVAAMPAFLSMNMTALDIPALMATAMSVLNDEAAPVPWRASVAQALAVMVVNNTWSYSYTPADQRLLSQMWAKQRLDARFEQLTAVCRFLTLDGKGGLIPVLQMPTSSHFDDETWLLGWLGPLCEAANEGLEVTQADVTVHLRLLESALSRAQKVGQRSATDQVAAAALQSLHSLAPDLVDPAQWLAQYLSVHGADGRCCETQTIAGLAPWAAQHTAQRRQATGVAHGPPLSPSVRARAKP